MIKPKQYINELFRTPPLTEKRADKIIRLDRNEHTTPFSADHLKKVLDSITPDEIAAYPELEPFYGKLSKWLKIDRQQLLVTSGSDTGIRAVFETYIGKGDEVMIFPPTYEMYSVYCTMFGGRRKEVFYNKDFSLPLEQVRKAISHKTKLIIIANPNHAGTIFKETELVRILKAAKANGALVLIDEAYYHFYDGTMLPYINKFDNLVIARTFSKAFGIASLRVGYLISNKDVIAQLYKVKLTHEITIVSAKFGEYLLDHLSIMKDYVREVKEGIAYLSNELRQLGIVVPKTYTNFLYAKLPEGADIESIVTLLKKKKYYIKGPFSTAILKGFIRITVGPVGQMRDFVSAFKQVYGRIYNKKRSLGAQ